MRNMTTSLSIGSLGIGSLGLGVLCLACLLAGCEVSSMPAPSASSETNSDAAAAAPVATIGAPEQEPVPSVDPSLPMAKVERGDLRFVEGYRQGYERAVREGRPMLVFFTAQWCHFCHQMASEAFTNPQVVDLSQRFVCILVDADAEPKVCEQFGVRGYPTIQFLTPRGVPLNRMVGKKPGHQLMMAMQAALQNVARRAEANNRRG